MSPRPPTCASQSAASPSDSRILSPLLTVQSSLLAGVAYDNGQATLQVEFRSGSVYRYFQVPRHTYQELLQANSKGAYFNRHIRGVFGYAPLHAGHSTGRCSATALS